MKRILMLALVLILALSLMTACGGNSDTPGGNNNTEGNNNTPGGNNNNNPDGTSDGSIFSSKDRAEILAEYFGDYMCKVKIVELGNEGQPFFIKTEVNSPKGYLYFIEGDSDVYGASGKYIEYGTNTLIELSGGSAVGDVNDARKNGFATAVSDESYYTKNYDILDLHLFNYLQYIKSAVKTGTDTVAGREATTFTWTHMIDKWEIRLWVDNETGAILKCEDDDRKETFEVIELKLSENKPSDVIKLSDYEIEWNDLTPVG